VLLHDPLGDGKTQAVAAAVGAGLVQAVEPLENVPAGGLRKRLTRREDCQQTFSSAGMIQGKHHLRTGCGVFQSVVQQNVHHLLQLLPAAQDPDVRRNAAVQHQTLLKHKEADDAAACKLRKLGQHILGGAALGFGFFGLIALISKLILKRSALGNGDIWLVGIGGLMLGTFPLLLAILIATLPGSIIELVKIKCGKQEKESEIAFGPYLLLGMGFMAIFGDALLDFYWKVVL